MERAFFSRFAVLGLAVSCALLLSACDSTPDYLRRDMQEKRVAETGVETLDPSGTYSDAGVSIYRDIDLRGMDARRIGSDTVSEGFHRYVHRCGTCHVAPSPALRTAREWEYVFPRMKKHMRETGLIPLGGRDQALILDFLRRHAAER